MSRRPAKLLDATEQIVSIGSVIEYAEGGKFLFYPDDQASQERILQAKTLLLPASTAPAAPSPSPPPTPFATPAPTPDIDFSPSTALPFEDIKANSHALSIFSLPSLVWNYRC